MSSINSKSSSTGSQSYNQQNDRKKPPQLSSASQNNQAVPQTTALDTSTTTTTTTEVAQITNVAIKRTASSLSLSSDATSSSEHSKKIKRYKTDKTAQKGLFI